MPSRILREPIAGLRQPHLLDTRFGDIPPNAPPAGLSGATLLGKRVIGGQPTGAWLCSQSAGRTWDDFLRGCEMGQFQQSSLWARTKEIDGWRDILVVLEQEGRIAGGFQILWRHSRFGRLGYISKGPVLSSEDVEGVAFVVDLLLGLIHLHRFVAIIAQPPDEARLLPQELASRGFLPNGPLNVISATCMVDLTGPYGTWEKRLAHTRRNEIRRSIRYGVTVREGGDSDVPLFFELMSATCFRQRVRPNPGSAEALRHLVRFFQESGEMRLSFAEYQGEAVACLMALKFGDRVTIWKKGWSGTRRELFANSLLHHESFCWAQRVGCKRVDFAGMQRSLAEHLLAQQALTEDELKNRDIFNLSFGARPRLLPQALIYWNSPLLRFLYSTVSRWPRLSAALGRAVGKFGS